MSRHAFISREDGMAYVPVKRIDSYGIVDALFAGVCSAASILDTFERLKQRDDMKDHRDHKILGFILGYLSKELKKPSASEREIAEQRASRPEHYCDDEDQISAWVETTLPNRRGLTERFAVICEPVKESEADNLIFHKSVKSAVDAIWDEDPDNGLEADGYGKRYRGYFGGNPQFLYQHADFERNIPHGAFDAYLDLNSAFRDIQFKEYIDALQQAILSDPQIKAFGMVELKDKSGKLLATVPKLPLICCACKHMDEEDAMPNYKPHSPSGLKMNMDSPYHSEWMIGGGVSIEEEYSSSNPIQQAALEWAFEWQSDVWDVENHILSCGDKEVVGRIRHAVTVPASEINPGDIVILPDGNAKYQLHIEQACPCEGEETRNKRLSTC